MKAYNPFSQPNVSTPGIMLDSCNQENTANIIPNAEIKSQTCFIFLFFGEDIEK